MWVQFLILAASAAITVVSVRFLLIVGIDRLCQAFSLSSKTKGQIIGYATSVPELVIVVSSAWVGVFDAGFWNIASSNIINCMLFALAVCFYKQHKDLLHAGFIDEIVFVVLSVIAPLVLVQLDLTLTIGVAVGLIVFFGLYKVLDGYFNASSAGDSDEAIEDEDGPRIGAGRGAILIFLGLVMVIGAGRYLGESAEVLIEELKIASWLVGWLLGIVTSIPEMTSFFEIYRLHKKAGSIEGIADTQENLDALVASNMSNLGIILPVGVLVYTLQHG